MHTSLHNSNSGVKHKIVVVPPIDFKWVLWNFKTPTLSKSLKIFYSESLFSIFWVLEKITLRILFFTLTTIFSGLLVTFSKKNFFWVVHKSFSKHSEHISIRLRITKKLKLTLLEQGHYFQLHVWFTKKGFSKQNRC